MCFNTVKMNILCSLTVVVINIRVSATVFWCFYPYLKKVQYLIALYVESNSATLGLCGLNKNCFKIWIDTSPYKLVPQWRAVECLRKYAPDQYMCLGSPELYPAKNVLKEQLMKLHEIHSCNKNNNYCY